MTHLQRIVECLTGNTAFIQVHNYPDADAISCAYGLRVLLAKYGITASICYRGKQDAYSTIKLVEELQVELNEFDNDTRLADNDEIIIVDCQMGNTNLSDIGGTIVACIDHHEMHPGMELNYRYWDIRPEVGACATIIADYFIEENVPFKRKGATLLTYGIRTDTANLSRGVNKKDLEVLAEMFGFVDFELIRRLENSVLYKRNIETYSIALSNTSISHNVSFSYAGDGCTDMVISHICDFMLSVVEVEISICATTRNDGIKLSVRSISNKIDAGKLAHLALRGIGDGGGHPTMAGAFVPYVSDMTREEQLSDIKRRFMSLAHKMGLLSRRHSEYEF